MCRQMLGRLVEVRPGRTLYVQTTYGNPKGAFAHCKLVALLMHGSMCHHSQVCTRGRLAAVLGCAQT